MSLRDDWSEMREKWRKTEASVEEGLIFLLLGNFCIMFSNDDSWDFETEGVPQDTDQLLWRFASWPSVAFWTNSQRTALHYAGSHITLRGDYELQESQEIMMGDAGNDDAGEPGHGSVSRTGRTHTIEYSVSGIPYPENSKC